MSPFPSSKVQPEVEPVRIQPGELSVRKRAREAKQAEAAAQDAKAGPAWEPNRPPRKRTSGTVKRAAKPKPPRATINNSKEAAEARRLHFLECLGYFDGNIGKTCAEVGISRKTYESWRYSHTEFAQKVDLARRQIAGETVYEPWTSGFAPFAETFFGHHFSWFHLLAMQAFEEAQGGDIIMFLWPPEHGKTTLTEDYINYKLGVDPGYRITIGTETGDMGEKMLARVKMRMEFDGPARSYVDRFGPFVPMSGAARKTTQPWAADHFDVWKKASHDERDYSCRALGMRSSVIGTRTDLLIVDDPQSRKSLGQTDYLLEVIRDDWLSRPGTNGHTVVNGSRRGDEDIYSAIQKAGLVDRLIKLPAYDEGRVEERGTPWLWPERYSERDYERLRRNAGVEVWERSYQQQDAVSSTQTFTADMLGGCHNPMRAVWHSPPEQAKSIYITLDPAIGSHNGISVFGPTDKKLFVLRMLSVPGLMSNQAILGVIEELCHEFHNEAHPVTDLVIEDKAFQKGMMEDTYLHGLIERFGFRVTGHTTGSDKYDENLGIPQMVHSLLRQEFDIPYADDKATRDEIDAWEAEMRKWRPSKGTKLRQDRVMSTWFGWLLWRKRRRMLRAGDQVRESWSYRGLPYRPTQSGLIVAGRP